VTRTPKDLGLSAQARLRNLAQQRGDDVQVLLTQFVLERLLHRLVASTHASDFVLKGAMLFAAWTKVPHRATRDLDLLGSGAPDPERLAQVFRVVCATAVEPDGVSFDTASVRSARIREDQVYEGIRVTLNATLATARIGVQVDIGFGDTVHPGPVELAYPSLLGLPTPRLLTYPRETVVAEKFQAMVSLGELNSRMKDFFDLFTLAAQFESTAAPSSSDLQSRSSPGQRHSTTRGWHPTRMGSRPSTSSPPSTTAARQMPSWRQSTRRSSSANSRAGTRSKPTGPRSAPSRCSSSGSVSRCTRSWRMLAWNPSRTTWSSRSNDGPMALYRPA
jgi:hypothetical protein